MSNIIKPANRCRHHPDADIVLQLQEGQYHAGRWNCSTCSKWVTWAKTAKTSEEMTNRQSAIIDYIMGEDDRDKVRRLVALYNRSHLNIVESKWYADYELEHESALAN